MLAFVLILTGCGSTAPAASETSAPPTSAPEAPVTAAPAAQPTAEPPTAEPVAQNDTLRLLWWQAPTILNPHLATGGKDFDASRVTYEPLASFNAAGDLVPFLAAEIPSLENGGVAADGTSVTWKLKPEIVWSDGEPFTAEDVQFTYEFISNPETAATIASTYSNVTAVEVIDPLKVIMENRIDTTSSGAPLAGRGDDSPGCAAACGRCRPTGRRRLPELQPPDAGGGAGSVMRQGGNNGNRVALLPGSWLLHPDRAAARPGAIAQRQPCAST